jgi:hypothetical protein
MFNYTSFRRLYCEAEEILEVLSERFPVHYQQYANTEGEEAEDELTDGGEGEGNGEGDDDNNLP